MSTKTSFSNMLNEYTGKIKNYVSPWTEMKPKSEDDEEEKKRETKRYLDTGKTQKYMEGFTKG